MAMGVNNSQIIELGSLGITDYPFTLVGWFRVPNLNKLITLMGIGNTVTGSYHRLIYHGGTTKSAVAISNVGSTAAASSSIVLTTDEWHHVAGTFEAANVRRVYLDGGNMGSNGATRTFDGADRYYLGNIGTDTIELAEGAIFKSALSAELVGMLAKRFSPLSLPPSAQLAAYQGCVRSLNWQSMGPTATAGAPPTAVEHPRFFSRMPGGTRLMPHRLAGPFHMAGAQQRVAVPLCQNHIAGTNFGQSWGSALMAAELAAEVKN